MNRGSINIVDGAYNATDEWTGYKLFDLNSNLETIDSLVASHDSSREFVHPSVQCIFGWPKMSKNMLEEEADKKIRND